jgi:CheY-like chemotaxis protein
VDLLVAARMTEHAPSMASVRDAPSSSAGNPAVERKKHVLFLDEEQMVVSVATRLLHQLGYTFEGFRRADHALEALRAAPHTFDIVVAECHILGMSGLEVARAIHAVRPDIPIGVTCSQGLDYSPEELTAAGIRAVLEKPFNLSSLAALLGRLAAP